MWIAICHFTLANAKDFTANLDPCPSWNRQNTIPLKYLGILSKVIKVVRKPLKKTISKSL